MSHTAILLLSFGIVILADALAALEALPKFSKIGGNKMKMSFKIWTIIVVSNIALFLVTYAILSPYAEEEKDINTPAVEYRIRNVNDWFFVDPLRCKSTIISGISYTPETFAKHYECTIEQVEEDFVRIDCMKMLNNIFFMAKGEEKCDEIYMRMNAEIDAQKNSKPEADPNAQW